MLIETPTNSLKAITVSQKNRKSIDYQRIKVCGKEDDDASKRIIKGSKRHQNSHTLYLVRKISTA